MLIVASVTTFKTMFFNFTEKEKHFEILFFKHDY